jgi:hypothetical protein
LIGRIIEAYVDDIIVKSKKMRDLVSDLIEVFAKLRQHGVKLNSKKCVFGVPRGMLLGFVVSERDIEANPEKISTIMDTGPIKNLKGVQCVTGCLAALSRFIARLGERNLPLYKLMKKSDHFTWTPEAQEALNSLKNMLKSPPILTAPTTEDPMLLYISATTQVVSATLVVEREEPGRSLGGGGRRGAACLEIYTVAVMSNDGRPSSIFSLRRRQLPDEGGRPVVVGSGSGSVHWMDARNGGSGRELKRPVSFPVPRCGDFDAKSELRAGYRFGSVHRCGQC